MPEVETISTGPGKVTTRWWSSILTPQTVVMICGAFVSIVVFWKDSKANWDKTKQLEELVSMKADKAETEAKIKATDDKVNRQYEMFTRIGDRIGSLEKISEYERGVRDGRMIK